MSSSSLHLCTRAADNFPLGRTHTEHVSFDLEVPFVADTNEQIYVSVMSVCLPNTYYNIDATRNTLLIGSAYGDQVISLSPMNYTADSLVVALNTLLTPIWGGVLQCTFSEQTGKLSFVNTDAGQPITIQSSSTLPIGLCDLALEVPASSTAVCPGVVDLMRRSALLVSESLEVRSRDSTNARSGSSQNIIAEIPFDGTFGTVQVWLNPHESPRACGRRNLSSLEFKLLDSATKLPLNLNGADWNISLRVHLI